MFQEHLPSSWEGEGRKKGEGGRERKGERRKERALRERTGGGCGGEREKKHYQVETSVFWQWRSSMGRPLRTHVHMPSVRKQTKQSHYGKKERAKCDPY